MPTKQQDVDTAGEVLARIRLTVGRAIGIADNVALTPRQVETLIERVCARAAETPGASLLGRDL